MNEVLKAIASRRSIRRFKPEQIKDDELHAILEAGLQAPSGANSQPWFFSVIQDRELIRELSDGSKREMQKSDVEWIANFGRNEKINIYHDAPTIIVVASRKDAITPVEDASAAVENMLIAAESLGIGSCWIGFARYNFTGPEKNSMVKIPEDCQVHFGIALGYKAEESSREPPKRKHKKYFEIIR